ncbi:MAG: TIGR00730 family Rossman fold protein [Candidatus Saccharibacteria bacterium]|nr:TIGR00730 family Rossman fold protein [Candidatus Saccharibacteria bacterium]
MFKKIKKYIRRFNHSSLRYISHQERRHAAGTITEASVNARMKRVNKEFKKGFKLLMNHPDTVTFFGSARFTEDNEYYEQARELAGRIVREIGSTVVTGGGGGIMEAANRGAAEAQGKSIGMTIQLPHEQITNQYVSYSVDFYYFFSRKVALSFTARAYVYFPGGFGTMDEFFEILTLKQTERIDPIPIILFGSEFWKPLMEYVQKVLLNQSHTISPKDLHLFHITDDVDDALRIISRSKPRISKKS